jgi:hypothetical protein
MGGLKPSVRQIAAMEKLRGKFSRGVKRRVVGCVKNDGAAAGGASPACGFKEKGQSRIVIDSAKVLAPLWQLGGSGFSVEAWAMVSPDGVQGRTRTVVGTGRFTLMMMKSKRWALAVFDVKTGQSVTLICEERVTFGRWYHLACTFDSVTVRLYVDGFVRGEADLDAAVRKRNRDAIAKNIERKEMQTKEEAQGRLDARLAAAEVVAREVVSDKKVKKELAVGIKKAMKKSKLQFRLKSKGKTKEELAAEGMKPIDANEAQKIVIEQFIDKKQQVVIDELLKMQKEAREQWKEDEIRAEMINAKRVLQPMRIGCGIPLGRHLNGADYFEGSIQHVSVYAHCVPEQRIAVHFTTATRDEDLAADRLNVLAARSLKRALRASPMDPALLAQYAQALCDHCVSDPDRHDRVVLYSKRVRSALAYFMKTGNGAGIIALMHALPHVEAYATLLCNLWVALRRLTLQLWAETAAAAAEEEAKQQRSKMLAAVTDAAEGGESSKAAEGARSEEEEERALATPSPAFSDGVEYVDTAREFSDAKTSGITLKLPELDIHHDIPGIVTEEVSFASVKE